MTTSWPIVQAKPEDASAIASIFAQSWTSPFSQLQFGPTSTTTLIPSLTTRITHQMEKATMLFLVIRDPETQTIAAIAQWTLPKTPTDKDAPTSSSSSTAATAAAPASESQEKQQQQEEEQAERQLFEDEIYRKSLPEHSNKDLILEFTVGIRKLRHSVLKSRPEQNVFILENLATAPEYRGRGLARRLVGWGVREADQWPGDESSSSSNSSSDNGCVIYLETARENTTALGLYKKLGFEEVGEFVIPDLEKFVEKDEVERCGGERGHTHLGLLRVGGRGEGGGEREVERGGG